MLLWWVGKGCCCRLLLFAYRTARCIHQKPPKNSPNRSSLLSVVNQAFVIGAISRAVATVVVFPYIRAKVIIMSRETGEGGGGSGSAASTSILSSLMTILKDDGVSALFQVLLMFLLDTPKDDIVAVLLKKRQISLDRFTCRTLPDRVKRERETDKRQRRSVFFVPLGNDF